MSGRYFCEDRYNCSLQLPTILEQHLASGYVIPHFYKGNNEVYYYAAIHGYAVFFDLRPHAQNAKKALICQRLSAKVNIDVFYSQSIRPIPLVIPLSG